ncbi:MAG: hypothetical protein KatS3mg118_3409 [Paracoccaceae bacterium]|nr:MAG: twin-arginine translocation signal domain-containing protein [Alphaproteobacteria bacterium]GIX15450.1 MAG: hypothetical protein KatS3mg118_3409 [Paracoccaceae bacterium]
MPEARPTDPAPAAGTPDPEGISRRDLLRLAGALPLGGAILGQPPAWAGATRPPPTLRFDVAARSPAS